MARDQTQNLNGKISLETISGGSTQISAKVNSNIQRVNFGEGQNDKNTTIAVKTPPKSPFLIQTSTQLKGSSGIPDPDSEESVYLGLSLDQYIQDQGSVEVSGININISIYGDDGHNGGHYFDDSDYQPQIKFNYSIKYREQEYTGDTTITLEKSTADERIWYNGSMCSVNIKDIIARDIENNTIQDIQITLSNMQQENINWIYPDDMYGDGLYASIQLQASIKYTITGATLEYRCDNKSSQIITPQYNLFGIISNGFDIQEVPVHVEQDGSKYIFTPCNIDFKNLIDLSSYTRVENQEGNSYKNSAILYHGILGDLDISVINVTAPNNSKYIILAREHEKFFPTNYQGSPGYNSEIITKENKTYSICKGYGNDYMPDIGLYKVIDEDSLKNNGPILQSCICYKEDGITGDEITGAVDYWKKYKGIDAITSKPKYEIKYQKSYTFTPIPGQSNQRVFKFSNRSKIDAPTLNGTQKLEFYSGPTSNSLFGQLSKDFNFDQSADNPITGATPL